MEQEESNLKQGLLEDRPTTDKDNGSFTGLRWTDVGLKVQNGQKEILRQCYGQVRKGELLGIVGSSGSGKTSLLNLLSFRLDPESKVQGNITFDGRAIKGRLAMKKISSFVNQNDNFHPNLTPRSTFS